MSIQTFFNQTGTLKNRTGYDAYGKEKQNAGTSVSCRVQLSNKTKLLPDGSTEMILGKVFFDPSVTVANGDHFVFASIDYRVMNLNPIIHGNGDTHHYEGELQKWQS